MDAIKSQAALPAIAEPQLGKRMANWCARMEQAAGRGRQPDCSSPPAAGAELDFGDPGGRPLVRESLLAPTAAGFPSREPNR